MSKLSRFLGLDRARNRELRNRIDNAVAGYAINAMVSAGLSLDEAIKIWRSMLDRI